MDNKQPLQSEINSVMSLFSNGEFEESLVLAMNLSKNFPESAILHNIIGACHYSLKNFESAIDSYRNAISIDPMYAKAYYNLADVYHNQGLLDESVKTYEESIKIDPQFADSYNNIGNVYRELGNFDKAIESYKKTISLKPDYVEALYSLSLVFLEIENLDLMIEYSNKVLELEPKLPEVHNRLGFALLELGELNDAVFSFQRAIKINPNYSEAHNNLGNTLNDLDELNSAINSYKKAIEINPDFPTYHNNLGNTFKKLGQVDNAVIAFKEALKHNPDNPDSLNNLGVALIEIDNINEAAKCFENAIKANPDYAEAYNNLGTVYKKLDKLDAAIQHYESALNLNPDYSDAHNNYGLIQKKLGKLDEAILSFENALAIDPNNVDTLNNLGSTFDELEQLDLAIQYYQNALKIKPDFAEVYNNLGHIFCKLDEYQNAVDVYQNALEIKPNIDYILGNLLSAKMNCCDWDNLDNFIDRIPEKAGEIKVIDTFTLFGLLDKPMLAKNTTQLRMSSEHPLNNSLPLDNRYDKHQKIRIGYFSGDFREHPVAYLTAGLYEAHDREHFEIHAFSLGPDTKDAMNLRIKAGVDHFHHVQSKSHKEIVELARSLEIDIAVDLAGLTAKSRTDVFAMSAAPIQLSYLGWLGTMGADYYDYLIADSVMIPEENQKYYTEKIVYLPSFQVNDSKDLPPDIVMTRKDVGLPEEGFVFCCFNNTYKFTPTTFDSWARILGKVDKSVLIVYANNDLSKTNLTKEIVQRGVAADRLIFGDSLDRPKYLARYRVADLFLDTQPYNAGTTASDALKMGLPMLTLKGQSYQSRMGASILNAVNLPELIANTPEEYEATAIEIATNSDKLKAIKNNLARNLSTAPLYNTALFTKNLETAYTEMYEKYHKGLEPDHIYVE